METTTKKRGRKPKVQQEAPKKRGRKPKVQQEAPKKRGRKPKVKQEETFAPKEPMFYVDNDGAKLFMEKEEDNFEGFDPEQTFILVDFVEHSISKPMSYYDLYELIVDGKYRIDELKRFKVIDIGKNGLVTNIEISFQLA